jgi:hypothetical protein
MEHEKHFTEWTRKEFEALPRADWKNDVGEVDSLIILPTRRKHDSGYRCMEFVIIQKGKPTYIVSGCSGVINLAGIGGYNVGEHNFYKKLLEYRISTQTCPRVSWSIDCLPVSGLLRLFCDRHLYIGRSLSSFEVFFKEDK